MQKSASQHDFISKDENFNRPGVGQVASKLVSSLLVSPCLPCGISMTTSGL